jgi:hypothetical protein
MKVAATLSLLLASTEAYYFYSLGDWGGSSDTEPTTQVEYNNAAGMVKAAHGLDASKPEFALLVGDNFCARADLEPERLPSALLQSA